MIINKDKLNKSSKVNNANNNPNKFNKFKRSNNPNKVNKFKNVWCYFKGIRFQSKLEREFYIWISKFASEFGYRFQFQVPYQLSERRRYVADFVFTKGEKIIVVDVKSPATITEIFKLKRDIMRIKHNIKVEVVFKIDDLIKLLRE